MFSWQRTNTPGSLVKGNLSDLKDVRKVDAYTVDIETHTPAAACTSLWCCRSSRRCTRAHYHRRHFRDAGVLPHGKVLEMVTIDAARALSLDHEIGSLEAGKKADIILIDLYRPHLMPLNMPVYRVTCFANASDVCTTIVDGRVLMEDRRVLSVDEGEMLAEVQENCELMLERSGLRHLTESPPRLWGASHY